jgi:hypothetical protein
LHSAIGSPEMATPTRPEATQQASDARFVMILLRACRACSAGLGGGENASRLSASVPAEAHKHCWIGADACRTCELAVIMS